MKNIMLTAVLAMVGFGGAFAQTSIDNKSPKSAKYTIEQRAQKATDELDKKLMLTPDQKAKIYQVELSKLNKSKDLMTQNLDKEVKKSQLKEMNKASKKAMYGVLTSDQQKKLKEIKSERKEKMAGKHKRGIKNKSTPLVSNPSAQN
ncbi:protein CpxP [Pedobacter sp. UYEF25]